MPLQNRVTPLGDIVANPDRGTLMGNRGGRLHRDDRTLGRARWKSRAWIACRLSFRSRQRTVMGPAYTELFFLDEATALAAGHRPCFECRRADAIAFQTALSRALGAAIPARAGEMDLRLHGERRAVCGHASLVAANPKNLPDSTMVATHGVDAPLVWLLAGPMALLWTPSGYRDRRPRSDLRDAVLVTPPTIVGAIGEGYRPALHPSALAVPSAGP